jgi:hypothetical protein
MKFLRLSCQLSIFVAVTVIFLGKKYGDEYFVYLFFINQRLNPKILSCFEPNLSRVCEP